MQAKIPYSWTKLVEWIRQAYDSEASLQYDSVYGVFLIDCEVTKQKTIREAYEYTSELGTRTKVPPVISKKTRKIKLCINVNYLGKFESLQVKKDFIQTQIDTQFANKTKGW